MTTNSDSQAAHEAAVRRLRFAAEVAKRRSEREPIQQDDCGYDYDDREANAKSAAELTYCANLADAALVLEKRLRYIRDHGYIAHDFDECSRTDAALATIEQARKA